MDPLNTATPINLHCHTSAAPPESSTMQYSQSSMAPRLLALALLAFIQCVVAASTPPLNGSSSSNNISGGGGGGFSFRLVAKHQPDDELGDLASLQRVRTQVKCRIVHRLLPPGAVDVAQIRPYLCPPADHVYAVMVGVGTGNGFQFYELEMDMSDSLTWMQCLPCHPMPCLPQLNPVFDPTKSPTFRHVPPASELCRAPYTGHEGRCHFSVRYRNAGSVTGYLARDTVSFPTGHSSLHNLPGIAFGCATRIAHFQTHSALAGVLGMGMGKVGKPATAFMKQVYGGHGARFSYCLITPGTTSHSFLRFGADIPAQPPHNVLRQSTMLTAPSPTSDAYYVELEGISVGGVRLPNVTPDMFQRDGGGRGGGGGCAVDIGTKLTAFIATAYVHIEKEFRRQLRRHGAQFVEDPGRHGHLCVHRTPAIVHMFQQLRAANGGGQSLCLGLVPDNHMTVIGAMQQINTRFIFDLHDTIPIMSFNPEDCHLDS